MDQTGCLELLTENFWCQLRRVASQDKSPEYLEWVKDWPIRVEGQLRLQVM